MRNDATECFGQGLQAEDVFQLGLSCLLTELCRAEEGISLVMRPLSLSGAFQVDVPVKAACMPPKLYLMYHQYI